MSINDLRVHFCVTSSWVYSSGSDEEREEVFRMLRVIGIEQSGSVVAEPPPYWWNISEEVRRSCAACVVSRANQLWVVFVNLAFPLTVRFVRPMGDQWFRCCFQSWRWSTSRQRVLRHQRTSSPFAIFFSESLKWSQGRIRLPRKGRICSKRFAPSKSRFCRREAGRTPGFCGFLFG